MASCFMVAAVKIYPVFGKLNNIYINSAANLH